MGWRAAWAGRVGGGVVAAWGVGWRAGWGRVGGGGGGPGMGGSGLLRGGEWWAGWGWARWDAGGPGGRARGVVRTFLQPERVFVWRSKDMEKGGKMLEKKNSMVSPNGNLTSLLLCDRPAKHAAASTAVCRRVSPQLSNSSVDAKAAS